MKAFDVFLLDDKTLVFGPKNSKIRLSSTVTKLGKHLTEFAAKQEGETFAAAANAKADEIYDRVERDLKDKVANPTLPEPSPGEVLFLHSDEQEAVLVPAVKRMDFIARFGNPSKMRAKLSVPRRQAFDWLAKTYAQRRRTEYHCRWPDEVPCDATLIVEQLDELISVFPNFPYA
ncbi:MAG: hypothetical protein AAF385_11505 [Pseudomonadota bacterium]